VFHKSVIRSFKTEIFNLHSNEDKLEDSNMSEVKKCPKCGGEMEKGSLFGASGSLIQWSNKTSGRIDWGFGERKSISAFLCENCGYVEIYKR